MTDVKAHATLSVALFCAHSFTFNPAQACTTMAPTCHAPLPLPPLNLLLCAAKRALTRHDPSIPARSPDPASTGSETIGPCTTKDLLGQHGRHSTNSGVSSGQPPSLVPDLPHPLLAAVTPPYMQCSLMLLEQEIHNVHLKIGQKEMEGWHCRTTRRGLSRSSCGSL
ncbi:hypothetical protein JVT61DRAFT_3320 [Boletus reticuloceps]|uniref:Uncharacterized protein n=1 Tax=Boletus reticuloceps TaxID=495285 RepID=A0A8I3A9H4_9AGAM|nr:hypothetical protein JVT61DRAFT_3320 [Boletus reticuloceps]